MLQLNLNQAIARDPDPYRLRKLEQYIGEALKRCGGAPSQAFENLLNLAEKEDEIAKLIEDVVAVSFFRHFIKTCQYLKEIEAEQDVVA
jgi:hypothetical protein